MDLTDVEIQALVVADTGESELEDEDDGWKVNGMTENYNNFAEMVIILMRHLLKKMKMMQQTVPRKRQKLNGLK